LISQRLLALLDAPDGTAQEVPLNDSGDRRFIYTTRQTSSGAVGSSSLNRQQALDNYRSGTALEAAASPRARYPGHWGHYRQEAPSRRGRVAQRL
jgi:hypothetical protein